MSLDCIWFVFVLDLPLILCIAISPTHRPFEVMTEADLVAASQEMEA